MTQYFSSTVVVCLPAYAFEYMPELLRDARRLAAQQGRVGVVWIAQLTPKILSFAESDGYRHHIKHSSYLYAKRHPARP